MALLRMGSSRCITDNKARRRKGDDKVELARGYVRD